MYKLINNEEITTEIKESFKKGITRAYLKVLATETEEELIINEDNYLQSIDFDDCRYVESEGIIGTVIAKGLNGKFINVDSSFNIENREIECYIGTQVGNDIKYLKLGTFIVQKPDNDNVNDNTTFEALDYMIKFNQKFEDRLNYANNQVTIGVLLQDICDQVGVTCGTTTFRNSSFVLENNQFVSGESCRDVLKAIAQMAFSWARINEDNELVLDFDINMSVKETIDYEEYFELKTNEQYGPLNTIVLRNSQVEGENYTLVDPNKQETDETVELVISDNPFAYTQEKRRQLAQAGVAIFGFNYIPLTVKTIGCIYLNCQDKLRIKNMQDELIDTYIFNNKIKYNGAIYDEKETPALTKTETKYKFFGDVSEKIRRTEIIVDKQNGVIESVVNTVTQQNNKISQVTQTVDELNSKIQDIADITVAEESYQANVSLENINQSEPIEIKVHSTGVNISYLYPHEGLYPSDVLYMPDRKIRFIRTYTEDEQTKTENIDYILPDDLLYYDNEHYDEFSLNYDSQTCQVTKRCKYNADGTVGLLDSESIVEYPYPTIKLGDGDYQIILPGYSSGYLSVRLMAANIYTTQFATKVEVTSEISQKADEITLEVSETYETKNNAQTNYSRLTQTANSLQSQINSNDTDISTLQQTAQGLTSTVSQKVGDDEVVSKINQSSETVQIDANKINLNGVVTANQNFKILSDGSMETKNGKFNGIINLIDSSTESSRKIIIENQNNSNIHSTFGTDGFYIQGLRTNCYYLANATSDNSSFVIANGDEQPRWDSIISMDVYDNNIEQTNISLINNRSGTTTSTRIYPSGIRTPSVTQTSLENDKKNFEKLQNGLDIVKATDIYKYNMKSQKDGSKKHIGFVIGDNYKYSKEITSENNDGVDTYSMVSVAYKAIQEQQEMIEKLQKEIKELKGEK